MLGRIALDQFIKTLDKLEFGSLELITPDGNTRFFKGKKPGFEAWMKMHRWDVAANLASKGDTGFAKDYQDGHWETNNLQNLLSLGLANDNTIEKYMFGNRIFKFLSKFSYLLNINTLRGSRKNIQAHYDLGNSFYQLWLDETMTYSSAMFADPSEGLVLAQNRKYDRILDRLDNVSGNLLEIGCGWGGFAERAAARGFKNIKGLTLSDEQHAYAKNRLGGKADIALEDYRIQKGQYDHIVSIEMFEAVGEQYWKAYFDKIKELLAQNGKAVIQTITIDDNRFEAYKNGNDVIRSSIFPGGMLPSPSRFAEEATKAGLKITNSFAFGLDYARTLEIWLKEFDEKKAQILALGYDEKFIRLWRFYLSACIAGFQTKRTDVMQIELRHI